MEAVDYCFLRGRREGCEILYVPAEKHLYVKKSSTKNVVKYICYQHILRGKKNKKNRDKYLECGARLSLNINTKICIKRNLPHSNHTNHEIIKKDIDSYNNMKDMSRKLRKMDLASVQKIPVEEVFNSEISK